MKIACCQFASGGCVEDNLERICRMAGKAADEGAELICFHECALCGYPPVEVAAEAISEAAIAAALEEISSLAVERRVHILLGTVLTDGGKRYNSAVVFGPSGQQISRYDKKALWGWDSDNFESGDRPGIFEINGVRVGVRICFDVRFPELFRQLYRERVELCVVIFSDTAEQPDPERYDIIKGHLVTRAAENVMTVVSANSCSRCQTAPTMVADHNGRTVRETVPGREEIIYFDYTAPDENFGTMGRKVNIDRFL